MKGGKSGSANGGGAKAEGGGGGKAEKPAAKSRLGLTKPGASSQKKGAEDMDSSPLYQVMLFNEISNFVLHLYFVILPPCSSRQIIIKDIYN